MTVARDAVLEFAAFTTGTPATLSFTPTGTPRAIVVAIDTAGATTDVISAVDYGGVAMTRIETAVDSVGEVARVYIYFLGASIPTGTQTVSITHTGSAFAKWAIVMSATAATDTAIVTFGKLEADQSDPQIALNTGATESLRCSILDSGIPSLASLTPLAGMEAQTTANSHDYGAQISVFGQQTTASTGSFTIGYTAVIDDVAMIAVAIQEAGPASQPLTGSLFTKTPTFPTGTVTATYSLTGVLFTKAPTFPQGAVTTGALTLTGTLFTKAPTFPQGAITAGAVSLTGVLFQKAPTFPTGTVTAGAYPLTGSLFVKAPTFFTGTIGQAGTLFGNLFVKAPTFFTGSLAQGGPSFWTPNPVAYVGVTRYGPSPWGAELSGQRFEKAPTFPAGVVS